MITDTFFTPSVPPTAPGAGMTPTAIANSVKEATSPVSLGYSFKHINREDVKHLTVNFAESDAMEVHIVPQGHLAGLMDALKQFPRSHFVRSVKFDDPFFQRYSLIVRSGSAILSDQIDSMIVNLTYGNHDPRSVAFDATNTKEKVEWALDPSIGWTVQYDVQISFKPDAPVGKSSTIKAGPFFASGHEIEINPRNFYALLPIEVHAVAVPWDRYAQIEVDLEYVDAANGLDLHQTLILNSAAPKGTWPIRLSDPGRTSFRYRTTYYPAAGPSIRGDWQDTDQAIISVRDLFSDVLKVTLMPAGDFSKVLRFVVTMAYSDPDNAIDQSDLLTLNSQDAMIEWSVRIIDRSKRAYTYAVTTFYRDGTVAELPPVPATDRMLAITGKYRRSMHIALGATGASFAAANLDHIDVALSYDDPVNNQHATRTVTLRSADDTGSFDYTVADPSKPSYNYEVTWFGSDGFTRHQAVQPSTAERLVIQIGA
jgi:hypothetical protein